MPRLRFWLVEGSCLQPDGVAFAEPDTICGSIGRAYHHACVGDVDLGMQPILPTKLLVIGCTQFLQGTRPTSAHRNIAEYSRVGHTAARGMNAVSRSQAPKRDGAAKAMTTQHTADDFTESGTGQEQRNSPLSGGRSQSEDAEYDQHIRFDLNRLCRGVPSSGPQSAPPPVGMTTSTKCPQWVEN
jgi:hypothetical protein